jgi:hypothetical protein
MKPFEDLGKTSVSINSCVVKYLTSTLFTDANLNQAISNESSTCLCQ